MHELGASSSLDVNGEWTTETKDPDHPLEELELAQPAASSAPPPEPEHESAERFVRSVVAGALARMMERDEDDNMDVDNMDAAAPADVPEEEQGVDGWAGGL